MYRTAVARKLEMGWNMKWRNRFAVFHKPEQSEKEMSRIVVFHKLEQNRKEKSRIFHNPGQSTIEVFHKQGLGKNMTERNTTKMGMRGKCMTVLGKIGVCHKLRLGQNRKEPNMMEKSMKEKSMRKTGKTAAFHKLVQGTILVCRMLGLGQNTKG